MSAFRAPLRVRVFPGAQNLPLYAALDSGVFTARGLKVELQFTSNSTELRDGLAAGALHVAHGAVDNAVAMVEQAGHDVVIVMGGDSSMNELFVQPDVASIPDLKGRTLLVDAPDTAYALQARKILLNHGLRAGDYVVKPVGGTPLRAKAMREDKTNAATLLNPPYSLQAAAQGLRSVGRVVDLIGPYQGTGAFAMHAWAQDHAEVLDRYLAAYIEALRLVLPPSGRTGAVALLEKWLKLSREIAEATYALLADPAFGLVPDAQIDLEGFRNVLALRAELEGQWGGKAPEPGRYLDPGYYQRALELSGQESLGL